MLNEAETKIFELSENRTKNDSLKKIEEYVGQTLDRLEELAKKQRSELIELVWIQSSRWTNSRTTKSIDSRKT